MEGQFENFVNNCTQHTSESTAVSRLMTAVSEVCQVHSASAQYGGSRLKRTAIAEYSDVDIVVSTETEVSKKKRKCIANEVRAQLTRSDIKVNQMQYKPVATAFDCTLDNCRLSFDLVFLKPSWCEDPMPPDPKEFFNQPYRQRAVRALKLLSKLNPTDFPGNGGYALEILAVAVDESTNGSQEDPSGYHLFIACMKEIERESEMIRKKSRRTWQKSARKFLARVSRCESQPSQRVLESLFRGLKGGAQEASSAAAAATAK